MKKLFVTFIVGVAVIITTYLIVNMIYNNKEPTVKEFMSVASWEDSQALLQRSEDADRIQDIGRIVLAMEVIVFLIVLLYVGLGVIQNRNVPQQIKPTVDEQNPVSIGERLGKL